MTDRLPGTVAPPSAGAGVLAIAMWEREIARSYAQHLEGGVTLKVLERRYGKAHAQLEAIAGRFPAVARLIDQTKQQRGRRAA